jgi:multiple sugar transport system permease protein
MAGNSRPSLIWRTMMTRTLAQPTIAAPAGRSKWTASRRREAITAYLFLAPFLLFFMVFIGRAVTQSIFMSFFDWPTLGVNRPFIGLQNYQELMNDPIWWISLKNTIIFAFVTVAGSSILALVCALVIDQPIKGRTFFRALFYAPGLLSVSVVAIAWDWLMETRFGFINYGLKLLGLPAISWIGDANIVLYSLSLVTIWWTFGFPMLIFLAGLQTIPDILYEAAEIDGANRWQSFRYITLPLLRPTILFVSVTGFVSHFQVFGQPYIMPINAGGPGNASYTVIIYLYETAWRFFRMGYGSAIAVSLTLIMVVFTIIQFRFLGQEADT